MQKITEQQKQIIIYLLHFRFLTRKQIQILLNNPPQKTVVTWIHILVMKEYLGVIQGSTYLYYLNRGAFRYIREEKMVSELVIRNLYKEKDKTELFRQERQVLVKFYLSLRTVFQEMKTKDPLATLTYFSSGSMRGREILGELHSDGYIEMFYQGRTKRILIELIHTHIPKKKQDERFANLCDLLMDTTLTKKDKELVPVLLCICNDDKAEKSVLSSVKKAVGKDQMQDLNIKFLMQKNIAPEHVTKIFSDSTC